MIKFCLLNIHFKSCLANGHAKPVQKMSRGGGPGRGLLWGIVRIPKRGFVEIFDRHPTINSGTVLTDIDCSSIFSPNLSTVHIVYSMCFKCTARPTAFEASYQLLVPGSNGLYLNCAFKCNTNSPPHPTPPATTIPTQTENT